MLWFLKSTTGYKHVLNIRILLINAGIYSEDMEEVAYIPLGWSRSIK